MKEERGYYLCLTCGANDESEGRYVRVSVDPGTPYFSKAIPCPACSWEQYVAWVDEHGVPPGMPQTGRGAR